MNTSDLPPRGRLYEARHSTTTIGQLAAHVGVMDSHVADSSPAWQRLVTLLSAGSLA
jgi:hypothetical protein